MKTADFYEVSELVCVCPVCNENCELDNSKSRYRTGQRVICYHCDAVFLLGESVSKTQVLDERQV